MKHVGPGLLFAGAAVGISHLVQSTRAGAEYGLSLILFVVLINLLKYPSFRFAIDYASVTGHSLIQGYRRIGYAVPYVYLAVFAIAAPIFVAAVGITTAAILLGLVGLDASPVAVSILILAVASLFLCIGNYRWLEKTNKVFVVVLTLSTVAATAVAIPRIDWDIGELLGVTAIVAVDIETLLFLVALGGFMPNPLDVSIAQSIWTLDAQRGKKGPTLEEARTAFSVGYVGSALLAVCFLLMGAGMLHGSGIPDSGSAAGFARQLIELFGTTLGPALGLVAAVSALSVMITTVLTAMDVYGRGLTAAALSARTQVDPSQRKTMYRSITVTLFAVASLMLLLLYSNFRLFIDFATTIAFITAPLVAILNYICVRRAARETDLSLGGLLVAIHFGGIATMLIMATLFFLA